MKYSSTNKPLTCMLTNSYCYTTTTQLKPVGVLWHSTGVNNPYLWRTVQPSDDDPNKAKLLTKIGTNRNKNDPNHNKSDKQGLNAYIGKFADGTVGTVQTMPWNYAPYGCGTGSIGSCNGWYKKGSSNYWAKECWIQFEIMEDDLKSESYCRQVFEEGCQLTAYLCKIYGFKPDGTYSFLGKTVPTILCHKDAHALGLGSNHGDVLHWFSKYGITMKTIRDRVTAIMKEKEQSKTSTQPSTPSAPSTTPSTQKFEVGDLVSIAAGATYTTGKTIPTWVQCQKWYVYAVNGDRITLNLNETKVHTIMSAVNAKYLTIVKKAEQEFIPYRVRVLVDKLNYRAGAGTTFAVNGAIMDRSIYTIVAEAKDAYGDTWGKLKSGAGWINLKYTKPI